MQKKNPTSTKAGRDIMDLLNNNDERELKIIELLTHSDDNYTVKDIAKRLDISERTLRRDINSINKEYSYLEIETGDVLDIQYKKNYSICKVHEDVIKSQPIFNLIDKIIYRDDLNITYLSAMLNVSVPTMYKNISHFNSYIKGHYNFKIETSPCHFAGSEEDIRAFLSHYLVEAYGPYTWPFHEIKEEEVEGLISTFFNDLGPSSDYSTYYSGKIIMALNLLFYRRGREIKGIEIYDSLIDSANEIIKKIKGRDDLRELVERLDIKMGIHEVLQIAYPFLSERFLPMYPSILFQENMPESILEKLNNIEEVIRSIEEHVAIEEHAKYPLITRLYNGLALGYYGHYADYILYEKGLEFYNTMKEFDPEIMGLIDQKIREFYPVFEMEPTGAFHRHMVNMLVMNWPNFLPQLLSSDVTSKVLIVSDLGVGHADMYKFRLKAELIDFSVVDVYDRKGLSVDWINKNGYKYVISNCDLKGLKEGIVLMVISTCPTNKDFDLVRETLSKDTGIKDFYLFPEHKGAE